MYEIWCSTQLKIQITHFTCTLKVVTREIWNSHLKNGHYVKKQ